MRTAIDDSLLKIAALKRFNCEMRQRACQSARAIVCRKKKLLNLEKTVNLLELLRTIHKTMPSINELI